jgi:hypothetical protein
MSHKFCEFKLAGILVLLVYNQSQVQTKCNVKHLYCFFLKKGNDTTEILLAMT